MNLSPTYWEPVDLSPGDTHSWQMGPLTLTIQRTAGDWRIVEERNEESSAEQVPVAETLNEELPPGRRWVAHPDQTQIQLKGQLPDRSVIVRPEHPLSIPPHQSALFYVGIPIWFQVVTLHKEKEVKLREIPAVVLSNSWFGSSTEGELCYALKTTARLALEDLPLRPYRAVCPLQIRNQSETALDFERLCLRVAHLQLFAGELHCWTSPARVTYRGDGEWSRVVYGSNAPEHEKNATLLASPREPVSRGILNKTFDTIRSYTE